MRIRELFEDYNQDLQSDLNNLLIAAKGNGAREIRTTNLVAQLQDMGYSVSVNSILPLLDNNPVVMNSAPDVIRMTPSAGYDSADPESVDSAEDEASKSEDRAMKTAMKATKERF